MNKACFVLTVAIVAINPASLFAGVTMVTQTTRTSTGCDFKVDKCETTVAEDPSYLHFKDYPTVPGTLTVSPETGNPASYRASSVAFKDYQPPPANTVESLLALIQEKLNKVNCPQVEFSYDETTGDITVRYVHSDCDCDCDWTINVRDVKADDFVWQRTRDNYSNRLGQMERRKFHTANAHDAQDIQTACTEICAINAWTMSKD